MNNVVNLHVDSASALGAREIAITRRLLAPPARVFQAWTQPAHLAQWWGPRGYINPVCEMDLRPGGHYRILMRDPDGAEYPVRGVLLEMEPAAKLVLTDDCGEMPDEWHDLIDPNRDRRLGNPTLASVVTVTFEDLGDTTHLEVRYAFMSRKARDVMLKMGFSRDWMESLDRLEAWLAAP
jgi:uncharacterized protein YndB with AHSA1/START domain